MKTCRNKKGFSLAELLIVVAIIAVLSAVAIPIFTAQLSRSRLAANQANARSALAAVSTSYMTDEPKAANATQAIIYYEYAVSDGSAKALTSSLNLQNADYCIATSDYKILTNISEWTTDTLAVSYTENPNTTLGKTVFKQWYIGIYIRDSSSTDLSSFKKGNIAGYWTSND
jgi:prepilin-type N-terminal cleavage/methylation domain-containing protein